MVTVRRIHGNEEARVQLALNWHSEDLKLARMVYKGTYHVSIPGDDLYVVGIYEETTGRMRMVAVVMKAADANVGENFGSSKEYENGPACVFVWTSRNGLLSGASCSKSVDAMLGGELMDAAATAVLMLMKCKTEGA